MGVVHVRHLRIKSPRRRLYALNLRIDIENQDYAYIFVCHMLHFNGSIGDPSYQEPK